MTKISEIPCNTADELSRRDYVKNFSKRMLKTQLFLGTFQEKRYVEPLNSYRDVVKVNSDEKGFIENVMAVRKKVKQELNKNQIWIGITAPDTIGAPVGYNLWVNLPIELFGTYWFKVKTVEFLENEVRLKLDVVRPLKSEKSASDISSSEDSQYFDFQTSIRDISDNIKASVYSFSKTHLTLSNLKETATFITLLIGTIFVGGINMIKYLMDYSLKFIREISGLIKVCTPTIISFINLISQTIYGLFSLIYMLCRKRPTPPQPVYISYNGNSGYAYRNSLRPALAYRPSSVRIVPLDN